MTNEKNLIYRKAYKELNEVIKRLSDEELSKIPNQVIENIRNNMDNKYVFYYDDFKKLEEQDFLPQTKALIVEIYEKYLCPKDKKEFWNKYDSICLNMIEKKKVEQYNPNTIFKSSLVNKENKKEETNLVVYNNKTWYQKIINLFSNFLNKIFGK